MTQTAFKLCTWSAWAAQLPDNNAWREWLPTAASLPPADPKIKPPCKAAPPMLRRRYSLTTKMAFETAMAACGQLDLPPDQPRLFYGSANGEIHTLKGLLESLSDDEPLSPMGFSNTVHHVPTGHYAMVTKHHGLSRTISAFEDTFAMMFIDILANLDRSASTPALLCLAEDSLPEPFDRMLRPPPFPYGVSMVIAPEHSDLPGQVMQFSNDSEPAPTPLHEEPVFEFLRWLVSDEAQLSLKTACGVLTWQR